MILQFMLAQALEQTAVAESFELAKGVTPTTMAGYALVVILMMVGLYTFFKLYTQQKEQTKQETQANREFNQKSLEVMIAVKNRLDDQQRMREDISEIKHGVLSTGKQFDALLQKLDHTRVS